jgi:trans-aconitate 2-methyltransferase
LKGDFSRFKGDKNTLEHSQDWNPDLYLKYRNERTQPAIDLICKIGIHIVPKLILDVGCGPGNSSEALLQRWPHAKLTGIDNSFNMIEKAKISYPNSTWIFADAVKYTTDLKYDIVFSNAAIQWIPNHENLFKKLYNLTNDGGVLAIQVPRFNEMPLSRAIQKVASQARWKKSTKSCSDLFTYHDVNYYYDLMSSDYRWVEFWQTDYIHILESQLSIIEWIRSTGLRPYLDCLDDAEKPIFENEILAEVKSDYPIQNNGKVLFPFRRLFMIGYK